jgi:starch synthase
MVSSEAAPLAKTGGLADVVGALPLALQPFGDEVAVLIPRYGSVDLRGARRVYDSLPIYLGPARYDTSIYQAAGDFPLYLLDCPPLYERAGYYGEAGVDYPDNHIRFAVFARAALAVARVLFRTEIFHCHDWQSGLLPAYLRTTFSTDPTFLGVKTLFTIHNLGYQGLFPRNVLPEIALDPSVYRPDGLEFFGRISYIKGGIEFADALNTVSPRYAAEIQTPEYGFGLDGALRARAQVLTGILNGVDYDEWNSATDPLIPAHYSASDLTGRWPGSSRVSPPRKAPNSSWKSRARWLRRMYTWLSWEAAIPNWRSHSAAWLPNIRAGSRFASASTMGWPTASKPAQIFFSCPAAMNRAA